MKRLYVLSSLLLLTLGGCPIRYPFGGCPYNEVALTPQFMTPWGTVLEQDLEALSGPHLGTLTWLDGDDVITVPKAGQAFEVEAVVDIDLSTARMHEYTRNPRPEAACELDRLFVDATVSFLRVDDGEVEFSVPFTIYRDTALSYYHGEAEIMPVDDFAPGLEPATDHDVEAILAELSWEGPGTPFHAEFIYVGQTHDSSTTGFVNRRPIAEFVVSD